MGAASDLTGGRQFDILWDNLSAKEHLVLFGTIKGLKVDSRVAEANKRIEEVRLTESANQRAGAFSGGMKRRLSVAVALIGNPEVVSGRTRMRGCGERLDLSMCASATIPCCS